MRFGTESGAGQRLDVLGKGSNLMRCKKPAHSNKRQCDTCLAKAAAQGMKYACRLCPAVVPQRRDTCLLFATGHMHRGATARSRLRKRRMHIRCVGQRLDVYCRQNRIDLRQRMIKFLYRHPKSLLARQNLQQLLFPGVRIPAAILCDRLKLMMRYGWFF